MCDILSGALYITWKQYEYSAICEVISSAEEFNPEEQNYTGLGIAHMGPQVWYASLHRDRSQERPDDYGFIALAEGLWRAFEDDANKNHDHEKMYRQGPSDSLKDIIIYYVKNRASREYVDEITSTIHQPTLLIPRKSIVDNTAEDDRDGIDPKLFVLVHAVQILVFAPVNLVIGPNSGSQGNPPSFGELFEYSRDPEKYEHRFPSTKSHHWEQRRVGGLFSLEDLFRAVCLYFHTLYRRTKSSIQSQIPRLNKS